MSSRVIYENLTDSQRTVIGDVLFTFFGHTYPNEDIAAVEVIRPLEVEVRLNHRGPIIVTGLLAKEIIREVQE